MRKNMEAAPAKRFWLRRVLAALIILALSAGPLTLSVFAKNTYIITDGDNVTVHTSYSSDPDRILTEAGYELGEEDTYTTSCTDGVNQITINRIQMVTVIHQGTQTVVGSYGETAGSLLKRMGITLGENDRLSCDEDTMTFDGMQLEIINVQVKTISYDEAVPFDTITYESASLSGDTQKILTAGSDGVTHYTAEVTYENGAEVSRRILSSAVKTPMVSEVVLCSTGHSTKVQEGASGTHTSFLETVHDSDASLSASGSSSSAGSSSGASYSSSSSSGSSSSGSSSSEGTHSWDGYAGTFTAASGDTVPYTKVLTCSATAYSCEGYTGYTYSGTVARVGAIAVDPSVIPLGSRLYIVTNDGYCIYGYCVAEDIGGGIKGNKVDLYFNTFAECYAFGRRTCTVYVLG